MSNSATTYPFYCPQTGTNGSRTRGVSVLAPGMSAYQHQPDTCATARKTTSRGQRRGAISGSGLVPTFGLGDRKQPCVATAVILPMVLLFCDS